MITPLRHSHPQTVFVASQKEVIGFDILEGNVRVKLSPAKANINALILCPNPFGLLYGASNGDIGFLGPSLPSVGDADIADLREGQTDENVLDSIYRSLVETPITFS